MRLHPSNNSLVKTFTESYKQFPESVKNHASNQILEKLIGHFFTIEECESPIEQLLGLSLSINLGRLEFMSEACSLRLQETINTNNQTYRVDFLVDATTKQKSVSYVIECDGHEFHEKTKNQAKRDKQRDRNLMSAGYKVLRFTGSEIYKDPNTCAHEVYRLVIKDLMSGD